MVNVNCETCGVEFKISQSRFSKNKYHNCSKKCLGIMNSKRYSTKITTHCRICKNSILLKPSHFLGENKHCCSRTCSAKLNTVLYSGNGNPRSLKLSKLEKYFWEKAQDIRSKSTRKGWECDIDYKYLIELYENQEHKCYYSGLPISPVKTSKAFNTLSIDRKDSSLPYIKGNIVLCVLCLNYFKSNFDMEDVKKVFDAISLKNKVTVKVKVKALSEGIRPYKKNEDDAGYDLFATEIKDNGHYLQIKTGVSVQPEGNFFSAIYNRSSNYKKGIGLSNGVAIIDKNYTGEIILNFLKYPNYKEGSVNIGDRVAQLILQQQIFMEPEWADELSETVRGDKGWGSSGN